MTGGLTGDAAPAPARTFIQINGRHTDIPAQPGAAEHLSLVRNDQGFGTWYKRLVRCDAALC